MTRPTTYATPIFTEQGGARGWVGPGGSWDASQGTVILPAFITFAAAGVAAAGAVTVAGTTVGQRILAIFGAPTAGGALAVKVPGTDFEAVVSVAGQIQQLAAANLSANTYVFIVCPAGL